MRVKFLGLNNNEVQGLKVEIVRGILTVIHVLVSVLLVIVILLQAAKGGGLSGTFGGQTSSTLFGPRGTASALSKLTQYLAGIFLLFSLVLSLLAGHGMVTESVTQRVLESSPAAALPPVESLEFGSETAPSTGGEAAEPLPTESEGEGKP